MASAFEAETSTELLNRIDQLRPDSARQWGKMNAPQMVCHLTDSLSIAMGEIATTFKASALSTRFVRWLIFSVLPIPKAKARTGPEFQSTNPGDWGQDVAHLREKFGQFVAMGKTTTPKWATHPAFGDLSTREWGLLVAKHMDHHLRQFGV
jgi:Protein of unknown function (DUF1569)